MKKIYLSVLSNVFAFIIVFAAVAMCACQRQAVNNEIQKQVITVIAASDFQAPSHEEGQDIVRDVLKSMKSDGISSADGFLCCGDYYMYSVGNETQNRTGIKALVEVMEDVVSVEDMVLVQGNHDCEIGSYGLAQSGNNDPTSGEYGVFVINEDDYMWYNDDPLRIRQTSQNLSEYLNEKFVKFYEKPIFVVSHLPLHYSMRTQNEGDGKYAKYIFDVLNEYGKKGLNIFFLFGHDHGNGWDDYLGGSSIYLAKGDPILIGQNSSTVFKEEILNFTYLNAGYVGYYDNCNEGSDCELTMTAFMIDEDSVSIKRYDKNGLHNLKSAGVTNKYKNETGYEPNLTVYSSPQTVVLNKKIYD